MKTDNDDKGEQKYHFPKYDNLHYQWILNFNCDILCSFYKRDIDEVFRMISLLPFHA